MVHNFETLFSAWDENFKNYEWFGCDWLGRIGQYSSLLAQDDQDLSAVRVLTGKFAKGDKHASIRQANEKTLIQLLDYLTRSEVNSTRVKSRLVTIMRNWAGSTPQLLGQYPDFESRLVQLIRRTFAGDNLGADSLVRALQSAAAIKVTSLATFMQKIKDTLAQSDRAGIDFNSFYANQIQRALSGIYNTGTDGRGGYLPLSPTDEKAAIALYRDFRLRAGSQLKYAFLSEEVRTARNHKLDKGPLFEMLNKELNKFGKYPVVGDSRPPHLTLIKCSELLAPEAKN